MQPVHVPPPYVLDVTTTSLGPAGSAGATPVISVGLVALRLPSSVPPIVTLVTSTKLVPAIVTGSPPLTGLAVGPRASTARPTWVKRPGQRLLPDVPAATTTSVAPVVIAAGAVPVIVVALTTCR